MLKNIPHIISPDLMYCLMSMGHGDEIVIADANFPSSSCAKNKLVRAHGVNAITMVEAILKFLPIDSYVEDHCVVMKIEPSDISKIGEKVPIWDDFEKILKKEEGNWVKLTSIDRNLFYKRAKKAFVIVATSETSLYANLIIKKGIIIPN